MPKTPSYQTSPPPPQWSSADITLLTLFTLGLLGWLLTVPTLMIVASILHDARYSHPMHNGEAPFMAGIFISLLSTALLLPAIPYSLRAKRLSMTWRIVALLPSSTGLLIGFIFLFWA